MYLIDDDYKEIKNIASSTLDQYFWYYDIKKKDFFLDKNCEWHNIKTDYYELLVDDKHTIMIPNNYFFLIGDMEMGIDAIQPDQMVGRFFEAYTFKKNMEAQSWKLSEITVVGYHEDEKILYPDIKNPVVVSLGEHRNMLVSNVDFYNRMKTFGLQDIV